MVLDTLTNLPSYNALNSHFAKVCAYLKEAHLSGLPEGRYPIDGDNAYLMISERDLKNRRMRRWRYTTAISIYRSCFRAVRVSVGRTVCVARLRAGR